MQHTPSVLMRKLGDMPGRPGIAKKRTFRPLQASIRLACNNRIMEQRWVFMPKEYTCTGRPMRHQPELTCVASLSSFKDIAHSGTGILILVYIYTEKKLIIMPFVLEFDRFAVQNFSVLWILRSKFSAIHRMRFSKSNFIEALDSTESYHTYVLTNLVFQRSIYQLRGVWIIPFVFTFVYT